MKINIFLYLLFFSINSFALCTGMMMNPVTSVCWSCLFPISIGPTPVLLGDTPDTVNFPSPICVCPKLGVPLPGVAIGLWEPIRMIDVSKQPFCFVNMGGTLLANQPLRSGSQTIKGNEIKRFTSWNVHYYIMPVLYLLSLALNVGCLEIDSVDLAYISEFDPLWLDDELSFIINPESVIFANPIAQLACAADCVASSVYLPLDFLFWCGGCQGSMYPLTGNISSDYGSVQTSVLAVQRFEYKLARQGMAWLTSTPAVICQPVPMPIMVKSQYRTQMTFPIPMIYPTGCKPFGRSNVFYDFFKEIPVSGENFGYLLWRKRNCCVL